MLFSVRLDSLSMKSVSSLAPSPRSPGTGTPSGSVPEQDTDRFCNPMTNHSHKPHSQILESFRNSNTPYSDHQVTYRAPGASSMCPGGQLNVRARETGWTRRNVPPEYVGFPGNVPGFVHFPGNGAFSGFVQFLWICPSQYVLIRARVMLMSRPPYNEHSFSNSCYCRVLFYHNRVVPFCKEFVNLS